MNMFFYSVNRGAPGTAFRKGDFTGAISGLSGITGKSK
jgi:hypothetical protein